MWASVIAWGVLLLAQAEGAGDGAAADAAAGKGAAGGGGIWDMLLGPWALFLIIGLMFYLLVLRPERAKRSDMAKMLSDLKINDEVVTIGGIYGTVVSVPPEGDRVTLRVDDKSNTRLVIQRSAISRVVVEEEGAKKAKS